MSKTFSMLGLIVALAILVIFGVDAATGMFFPGGSAAMDYGFIVAGLILAYMSVATFRELP